MQEVAVSLHTLEFQINGSYTMMCSIFWCSFPCTFIISQQFDPQVETFGSMAKTEKIAFILEQVCGQLVIIELLRIKRA
jgi:hypothetical protein